MAHARVMRPVSAVKIEPKPTLSVMTSGKRGYPVPFFATDSRVLRDRFARRRIIITS